MSYEMQYMMNLMDIMRNGSEEQNVRTGIITKRLPATQIIVDLEKEFPILLSKKVYWKSAIDEILWIMQKQANRTAELNSKIWDSWTGEDGTIGKSYGYQVGKPTRGYGNQVEYILETLKKDPSNRQCVINMWNVAELDEMNLVPCTYSSVWNIIKGRLNCMLVQRSADYPVGVPFDTTQYAVLTHLFARHLNVRPGILTHVMADSHIYANQYGGVNKQISQFEELKTIYKPAPEIMINPDVKSFWDITINDINVINYDPMPAIKYEVAV
jgi:thymidylate synthase